MTSPLLPQHTAAELHDLVSARLGDHLDLGEHLHVASAQLERVLQRVHEWAEGHYILAADRGARATGTVTITFTAGTLEGVRLLPGVPLFQTPWGVEYRALSLVTIPAGASNGDTLDVAVEAVLQGWDGNVAAGEINEWVLPDSVDPGEFMGWGPGNTSTAEAEFIASVQSGAHTVTNAADTSGGSFATLDLLAAERGLPAADGETARDLRRRIQSLPRVVTPNAILSLINEILAPYDATATMHEAWDSGFGFVIGESAIGDQGPSRLRHFVIVVSGLAYEPDGFVIGDQPNGAIGSYPIGVGDESHAGIIDGVQQTIDQTRAAGIWAYVTE